MNGNGSEKAVTTKELRQALAPVYALLHGWMRLYEAGLPEEERKKFRQSLAVMANYYEKAVVELGRIEPTDDPTPPANPPVPPV